MILGSELYMLLETTSNELPNALYIFTIDRCNIMMAYILIIIIQFRNNANVNLFLLSTITLVTLESTGYLCIIRIYVQSLNVYNLGFNVSYARRTQYTCTLKIRLPI